MEQFNTIGIKATMASNFIWPRRCFPEIVTAGRYYHDDHDFLRIYKGSTHAVHLYFYRALMKFDDNIAIQILPGDVTISPANKATSYSLEEQGRHLCIHFMPQRRTQETLSLPLHIRMGTKTQQAAELFGLISRTFMQYKLTASDYSKLSASTGLQRLIVHLSEFAGMQSTRGRDYSVTDRLTEIIDSEYADLLCVPELAHRVGLSQNYLARMFREHYGVTIPRYILTLRIEKAKELLEITDLPIGCIGQYVGLHDPHYFNKMFRKLAGMNPSDYRRIIKRKV